MSTQSEAQSEAKKAKLEKPANHYESPDDITKDADLSPDEKRQALNTWEQDARQMMTASNEGMSCDEEGWTGATRIASARWCARRRKSAQSRSTNRHSRCGAALSRSVKPTPLGGMS